MTTKTRILELHGRGYNYNQIKKELGCSKGTISYHLGVGQKEKTRNRSRISKAKKRKELLATKLNKNDNIQ